MPKNITEYSLDRLNSTYYSKLEGDTPQVLLDVRDVFNEYFHQIRSYRPEKTYQSNLGSNVVLSIVRDSLETKGFLVERSRKEKVPVHVFDEAGSISQTFNVDAYHKKEKVVVEIEAGMGLANMRFLKDAIAASLMNDADYLVIALCNYYEYGSSYPKQKDYAYRDAGNWLNLIFNSDRMSLDVRGILLIGY